MKIHPVHEHCPTDLWEKLRTFHHAYTVGKSSKIIALGVHIGLAGEELCESKILYNALY